MSPSETDWRSARPGPKHSRTRGESRRRPAVRIVLPLVIFIAVAAGSGARAAENRFWLADQYDWGAKTGFYLGFENTSVGDNIVRLSTLRLILGVGSGTGWKFIVAAPAWSPGHDYTARAVVGPRGASFWLDGAIVGSNAGAFVPDAGPLLAGHTAGWASGASDYVIIQRSLDISSSTREVRHLSLADGVSLPLTLFQPGQPASVSFPARPGETVTFSARFSIVTKPNLRSLSPFVDRYGQNRYATWPGKISRDSDLAAAAREESRRLAAWGVPAGYDRYGGDIAAPWHEKSTGFYRVVQHNHYWWLVSPDGNPCFYRGICTCPSLTWDRTPVSGREFLFQWLPSHTGAYAPAWGHNDWGDGGGDSVAFLTTDLIRKYGVNWQQKETTVTARRIAAWGFNGLGKWSGMEGQPSLPVLSHSDIPNLVRHPDIFDPAVARAFRASIRRQVAPRSNDPMVVGWSVGNEYDEIITLDEIRGILAKATPSPSKRALIEFALKNIGGGDPDALNRAWNTHGSINELAASPLSIPTANLETLRHYYGDYYYAFVEKAVKDSDPHHLYLGFWIVPGWWQNESDWALAARHCDVIGYDHYSRTFADPSFARLIRSTGKPVLCGEFSFPPWYRGKRGFGIYDASVVPDEPAAGKAYASWLNDAARNPYCVGVAWFQYRDEPVTGRGPGKGPSLVLGEHYAFGLIDTADNPKLPLVTQVRAANLSALGIRLRASH